MHISEQVAAELISQGWDFDGDYYRKARPTGGMFGEAIDRLCICPNGRWFERHDGWGNVECEVDLRDYVAADAAVAAVLA